METVLNAPAAAAGGERHLVENFFCSIKAFRRIATRYEKTDKCFASLIDLVATILWTR